MKSHRFYVVIDTESVVADDEHARYLKTERFSPRAGQRDSGRRRGQRGGNDPLTNARWMFQSLQVATVMVCATHADGNIVPVSINTFAAPEHNERAILEGMFAIVDQLPPNSTELVSYGGAWADVPLIVIRSMKHGLTLPRPWRWMAFGGQGKVPHLDLMRLLTGSSKMKASHMSEFAAVIDVPAKVTAAPWRGAEFIRQGQWQRVAEMCECDCISTSLLLANWRLAHEPGAPIEVVHDRIYRVVEELCPGRGYIPALKEKRRELFDRRAQEAWARLENSLAA